MIKQPDNRSLIEKFDDRAGMDAAINAGVRAALLRHMLLGESVATLDENGKVKLLGPDEIRKALEKTE